VTESGRRIGDAATTLAVATHVLRRMSACWGRGGSRRDTGHMTTRRSAKPEWSRSVSVRAYRSPRSKNSASATAGTGSPSSTASVRRSPSRSQAVGSPTTSSRTSPIASTAW